MQNAKKTLSILLSLLLVLAVLPMAFVPAFADPDPEPGITFSFDDDTKTLTISGRGPMDDYQMGNQYPMLPETPWSAYRDQAEKLVISEGITHVGDCAFVVFTKLTQVTLPSTLTSIGDYAFAYCFDLATVNLPSGLTGIGEGAFVLNSIAAVTIPAGVEEINQLFMLNFVPLSITLCEGLKTVSDCFTSTVMDSLTIPASVETFECGDILNVHTLVNNSALVAVSDALTSMDESKIPTYLLMMRAEYELELSYLVTGEAPTQEDYVQMMIGVYNQILGTNYATQEEFVEAMNNGEIDEDDLGFPESVDCPLQNIQIFCLDESAEHTALRANGYPHYIIDNNNALCTEAAAVKCGDNLTWAVDAETETLTISGYGEMYDEYKGFLFYRNHIKNIVFQADEGETITKIGYGAFDNLGDIDLIELPDGVTTMNSVFNSNVRIAEIRIPAGFTYTYNGYPQYVFNINNDNCFIGKFTVDANNPVYFSYNGDLYLKQTDGSAALIKYTPDENGPAFYANTGRICEYAFSRCDFTDITIPASVTSVDAYAFYSCKVKHVAFENGVNDVAVGAGSFPYCDDLESFSVSENDARFSVIDGVLYNKAQTLLIACPAKVTELTLPATATGIAQRINQYACVSIGGVEKLTVLNPDFDFTGGHGTIYYGDNYAFAMNRQKNAAEIKVYGYGKSTAEAYALTKGYTFTALDDVTVESVAFDFSESKLTAEVNEYVYFEYIRPLAVLTYSDGTTKTIAKSNVKVRYINPYGYSETSSYTFNTAGEYTMTASYGAFSQDFTFTVTDPDYTYEFDTTEAVTKISRYAGEYVYSPWEDGNRYMLGVKLKKVFDDPEKAPEYLGTESASTNTYSVYTYAVVNGEQVSLYDMTQAPAGTYEVHYVAEKNGAVVAHSVINVEVVEDNVLTLDFTNVPATVAQFSSFTLNNWGMYATLTTASGATYNVTAHMNFNSDSASGQYLSGSIDTSVAGERTVRPRIYVDNTFVNPATGAEEKVNYNRDLDHFTVTVTAAEYDHIRIDVPESVHVEPQRSIYLRDYVNAYMVFADSTEELITDKSGFTFSYINGYGNTETSANGYCYFDSEGERTYTVSYLDASVELTVSCVQTIFYTIDTSEADLVFEKLTGVEWGNPYSRGIRVYRTENGNTTEITDSVSMDSANITSLGEYTAYISYREPGEAYYQTIGYYPYTVVPGPTIELRGADGEIIVEQYGTPDLSGIGIYAVKGDVETPLSNVGYSCVYQGSYWGGVPTHALGAHVLLYYGYYKGTYIPVEGITNGEVTVRVICAEHDFENLTDITAHDAVAGADCLHTGTCAYLECDLCGARFTADDSHTLITGDLPAGPYGSHTLVHHDAVPATTCTETGTAEYWDCSVCQAKFSDENGVNEVSDADLVIPAGHVMEFHDGAQASCTENGNLPYYECTRCGNFYIDGDGEELIEDRNEVVLPAHHTLTKTDARPATCTEAGNTEYWVCSVCGDWFSDENGTAKITDRSSVVIGARNHNYGAWTKISDTQHQRVCANDPNHKETADHTWNGGTVTTPPTCATKGVKTFTCTACGATKTQEIATVGHKDDNNDGWCDYNCGTAMGGGTQPTDPGQPSGENLCKYCHQPHTGFWGRIVQFFHNIAYFFAHLFGKM